MYQKYADDIFRYLYVHVRDRQLAEDLTADTFTRAWKGIDSFDFAKPRPWLYKIARNLMMDHWRRKQTVVLEAEDTVLSDTDSLEDQTDRQLAKDNLHKALAKLPEEMRSVVTMRFILGYSARKTAQSMDLSEANVRVIQYRALKKLRGLL